MSPEVAESEHLRKQIETLERELHSAERHEHEDKSNRLKRFKSKEGRKYITRPKIRAYFEGNRLFRSKGDNEYAATASISLFSSSEYLLRQEGLLLQGRTH